MEKTKRHNLPYIMASQAQKHVTHNEALRMLDALINVSVKTSNLANPPTDPSDGDAWIVAENATGDWLGKDGQIASRQDAAWSFFEPLKGWLVWNEEENQLQIFDGIQFSHVEAQGESELSLERIAVNTGIDPNNRLSVASPSTRFSHDGTDHRIYVNKADSGDTSSVLFQVDNSTRGEIGLTGNNDLVAKASADGIEFRDAIRIQSDTGEVEFPHSNYVSDFNVNLYAGSGRLCATDTTAVVVGGFKFPSYFAPYNGSVGSGVGKFVHNNADYGGTAAALAPTVRDLVDKIREPTHRRFGLEFWVAEVVHGAGTIGSRVNSGETFYISMFTQQTMQLHTLSLHLYLRAIDSAILVKKDTISNIFVDGVEHEQDVRLEIADGWRSVLVQRKIKPRIQVGYQPWYLEIYSKTAGDKWQFACPALLPGLVAVDPDSGIIPAMNSWPS